MLPSYFGVQKELVFHMDLLINDVQYNMCKTLNF